METTETDRKNWNIDSLLQVFVPSRNKWYDATITEIFRDKEGEWLIVSIQNKILFELNRFDSNLRRHKTKQEIEQEMKENQRIQREKEAKEESDRVEKEKHKLEMILRRKSELNQIISKDIIDNKSESSDGDLSTDYYTESNESSISSIDSSSSDSDSLDSVHSDDELYTKFGDEKNDDPALIVIIVERAGTHCVNGKYLYNGQQRGKPLWQKDGDQKGKLWWKYDNLWTLEYDNNDLYIAYTTRILPPSSGWESVDNAEYPSPSVILHRLNQMETIKNYVTGAGTNQNTYGNDDDNDNSFSPLEMMEYDFEIINNFKTQLIQQQFGFSLQLNDITGLMYVNNIIEYSQAQEMGLQIGDIISNVEEDDISLIGNVDKMYTYLKNEMTKLKENKNSFININFGRKKGTFPIVLVDRSGTAILDGKYSIKGRVNGAWKFVQNDDPKYEIYRIYNDSDEDEAIWVMRTEAINAIQAAKEEEERLLFQKQNEEEHKRRQEEEERIKQQQLEEERKQKIVDERWLFPLFKDAQLSNIIGTGSADTSKCKKEIFIQYFVDKKKVNIEIVEIIWKSIDRRKKGVITTRQFFAFKTNFTIEKMRKKLPEFCPTPENVLKSQQATAKRKKEAEIKRKDVELKRKKEEEEKSEQLKKEADSTRKRAIKKEKPLPRFKKKPLPSLPDPKTTDELKKCGFTILKDLCKKNNIPPNGTRAQLFIKLRDKLFSEEKKEFEKDEINVVVSTANDQKKRKKSYHPYKKVSKKVKPAGVSPRPKKDSKVYNPYRLSKVKVVSKPTSPAVEIATPLSVEIRDDIDNKEEIFLDLTDESESEQSISQQSEQTILDYSSLDEYSDSSDEQRVQNVFKDYYCGMSGCKDKVPPNYGWEAIEPNGEWPAPGLNVYDIELSKQNLKAPVIEKVVPSPGCATVYFSCDEPRIPNVCKHMECWFEIEAIGNDQVVKCTKSPAVFTNLINGNNYQFIVKCCSILSTKYSEKSEIITPLLLPNKPYFTNIEGKPKELFLYWNCKNYNNKDRNATVILITTPIISPPKGYQVNDSGEIILNSNKNDKNVIHLTGLKTGTQYEIQLRSSNAVGTMESAIEIATPTYPPPQPIIKKVISGNREIIIDVQCDGWDELETKCWFQVDVNPQQPTLEFLQQIYTSRRKKKKQKQNEKNNTFNPLSPRGGVIPSHLRKKSVATMNRLASARSRATFSTVLYKIDLSQMTSNIPIEEDEKNENAPDVFGNMNEDSHDEIPLYKRNKRYHSLPIIISPLINGEEYVVTVRARNYTGIKSSTTSDFVTPIGVPPKPRINSVYSRDGEVKILFECDDYSTLEYRAVYEIISTPKTSKTKTRRFNMKFRNLDNGTEYVFKIRGVNSIGKGEWSDESKTVKPLKLPLNIQELRMVPGNEEISLYWVSDDLNHKKYNGWYEITTRPMTKMIITRRQQCTFKGLMNDLEYKFKIYGVNIIGRSNKFESVLIKPKANVKIGLYNNLKLKTSQHINELRENYYKKIIEKDRRQEKELGGDKRKKGKIIDAQQQFNFEDKKDKKDKKMSKNKKKNKKKKKDKKKKKKTKYDLGGFASMVKKQQNKQNDNNQKDKTAMHEARSTLFSKKRQMSIMDINRIDNFSHKFQNIVKK